MTKMIKFEYEECDGLFWQIETEKDFVEVDATMYRYVDKKIKPDEMGFKYHILTFKEQDPSSAEVMSAYIGDIEFFVNNYASLGYNGLMVKHKSVPKKTVKEMFKQILTNLQFPDKIIYSAIKQV